MPRWILKIESEATSSKASQDPKVGASYETLLFKKGAYDRALENRRFEIDNYWKRTTYFWTLIAALLTGHFVAIDKVLLLPSFSTAALGLIVSFGWFLTNKASKFWQENWEGHVDALEDSIDGPIYKTVFVKTNPSQPNQKIKIVPRWIIGAENYSVSKINQLISFSVFLIWNILLWVTFFYDFKDVALSGRLTCVISVAFLVFAYVVVLMLYDCRSDFEDDTTKKLKGPWRDTEVVLRRYGEKENDS